MHPNEAHESETGKDKPAGRPQTRTLEQVSKDDGENETAESAHDSNKAAYHTDFIGEVLGNMFVDRSHPESHENAREQEQTREDPWFAWKNT